MKVCGGGRGRNRFPVPIDGAKMHCPRSEMLRVGSGMKVLQWLSLGDWRRAEALGTYKDTMTPKLLARVLSNIGTVYIPVVQGTSTLYRC